MQADSTRSHIRNSCGSVACLELWSYATLQLIFVLLCLQALFALDAASAQEAMLQFQSCVRTTLLLCDGYECQEKVHDFPRTQITQQQHLAMLKFNTRLVQRPKQYMMHCAYATIAKLHEALQHDIVHCPLSPS